jgi:hypothetical protein
VIGFLEFTPPLWFRYFHFAHHRFAHDLDLEPEVASPEPETLRQYLARSLRHSALDSDGLLHPQKCGRPKGYPYIPPKGRAKRSNSQLYEFRIREVGFGLPDQDWGDGALDARKISLLVAIQDTGSFK